MREAHGDHTNPPKNHDDRDEDTGSESLKQGVRQGFEEGVRDEEDRQAGIVLATGNVKALLKTIELGIPDIWSR